MSLKDGSGRVVIDRGDVVGSREFLFDLACVCYILVTTVCLFFVSFTCVIDGRGTSDDDIVVIALM